jgi:N-acetylneuraminate synthase
MKIGNKEIGNTYPCFITAEIGLNANGSVETAKKLIDVAIDAGCDAVKFQKRTVDVVYTREELARPRESPFGTTNGDLKRGLEFGIEDYSRIDTYCRACGIPWFASAWDIESVDFLEKFDVPAYKVASACLTDLELLERIEATGKPVIMSTGMSTEKQVLEALGVIGTTDTALLVTTSTYPCSTWNLNLRRIETFQRFYPSFPIGYSNHHPGIYASLCAVVLGASILEVHITLSRASWGSDQAASIEPTGLKKLVCEIRDFELALGSGEIRVLPEELPILEKLRRVK